MGEELEDFADAAALIEILDLVITVDTAVAHLAGAVGKPVWILLPHVPDWRWLQSREDSPWYPTARLFRQTARRDWGPVIERVGAELERLFKPDSGIASNDARSGHPSRPRKK
jgi:ADP-heptose:LPS heptosyltransferase